jgi:O-antigen/teichoic acid export membrane protein
VFVLLVPLLTIPYLSRVLGPQGVGINSYTNSIMQYFVIFGCIGTNIYGNRKIAFVRDNDEKLSQTFWEILFLRIILLLVGYVAFLIMLLYVTPSYRIYYLSQSLTIIGTMFDISWFFMGIERFSVTVVKNFIVKIITLVSIFLFVKSFSDLSIYIFILSLSLLLGNLSMFPSLRGCIYAPRWKQIHLWKHLNASILLFIPEVASQVYVVLNKTMLGSIISVESSGYYDQSDKIVKIVLALATATGTVMLPHVANAFSKGEVQKTKEYLYDTFALITMMSVPMCFGIIGISSKLVPLFFSSKFMVVSPLLDIESVVIILIAWSNAIGFQYLVPTNRTKKYTASVILGSVVNIVLNIPLILIFNTLGAIIATIIAELSITSYQLYSIREEVSYKSLFDDTYKYLFAGIIMFIAVYGLNMWLPVTWLALALEMAFGAILYILIIFIWKANVFTIIDKLRKER